MAISQYINNLDLPNRQENELNNNLTNKLAPTVISVTTKIKQAIEDNEKKKDVDQP